MGKFFRKHKEGFIIGTLIFFFLSIFVGIGSVFFTGVDTRQVIAKVGPAKIDAKPFYANMRQMTESIKQRNPSMDITSEMEQGLKTDMLRDMIIRTLFNMEARRWGLKVAPQEVAQDIVTQKAFQKDGQFNPQAYYEFTIRNLGLLPKEYEKERAEDILSMKFRGILTAAMVSTEPELKWLWRNENPAKSDKDWIKERNEFANRIYNEKMVALLNQLLGQLSQKNQIQTFLN